MPQGVLHRLTRMSDECRTGFAFGRESTKVRGTHAPVPPQLRCCCLQRNRLLNVSWGPGRWCDRAAIERFVIDDRVLQCSSEQSQRRCGAGIGYPEPVGDLRPRRTPYQGGRRSGEEFLAPLARRREVAVGVVVVQLVRRVPSVAGTG